MQLTVIIPTRHEAETVQPLTRELREQVKGLFAEVEVLFVDDSDDDGNTVAAIEGAARGFNSPGFLVRHYHRKVEARWGGLAGAVVDGFRRTDATLAIVMDGDGQHPPETIPYMLKKVSNGCDLVLASRYCPGGNASGLNGLVRHFISRSSTLLAKLLFPRTLNGVTDPMTGFFAVRLDAITPEQLRRTRGFKILLEILIRHYPQLHVGEVPFSFGERKAGTSSSGTRQGLQFLRQLLELRAAMCGRLLRRTLT